MKRFVFFLFISLFFLFSLVLITANASGQQCLEEDSGTVDLEGTQGKIGQEIQIPVRIQSAPNEITCFGFEITYNPDILEYLGFERGDLTISFDMLGVNQDPDNFAKLIVGGFCSSECEISQEANGCLIRLKFKVKGGQENNYYPLYLEKLEDNIANLSSSGGCFYLLPDNNPENKVTIPVISPISTIFTDSIEVTITCTTSEAIIRYTTDGSNPTENSLAYSGPITLADSTTIKAQGFKSDWTQSDIASKTYTKQNNNSKNKVTIPVISPISTIFTDSIEVTITCDIPEATIRYTSDGSNPTENSSAYYGPITLTDSTTIKAQGFKSDWTQSDIASKTYTKQNEESSPENSKYDGNNNSEGKNSNGHNTGLCFLTSINLFSTVKSSHPIGGRVR